MHSVVLTAVAVGLELQLALLLRQKVPGIRVFRLYRISTSQLLNWGTIAATTVLTILPVLVVFAFVQRWLIEGLLAGAVKG